MTDNRRNFNLFSLKNFPLLSCDTKVDVSTYDSYLDKVEVYERLNSQNILEIIVSNLPQTFNYFSVLSCIYGIRILVQDGYYSVVNN
jgi:hypothetical protein